jgi:ABC-type xylose transport system permease subunit
MAFPRKLKELCTPAFIYFLLSVIGIVATVVSNLGGRSNMYTLGHFSTPVPHTGLIFIIEVIYVLFWTWILNLMCKDGHREIAWFLVLLPFVLFFILLFTMGRTGMEGFKNPEDEDEEEEEEPMEAFTDKKIGLPVPNGYN